MWKDERWKGVAFFPGLSSGSRLGGGQVAVGTLSVMEGVIVVDGKSSHTLALVLVMVL